MIPRLVTVLVLVVAIVGVSWGMRARAQSDTLEDRVAALEAQVADLQARSLPAADPSGYSGGVALLNENNSFKLLCYINTLAMGNQYEVWCMRSESSVPVMQPTTQAPGQSSGDENYPVGISFVDNAGGFVGGACVRLYLNDGTTVANLCDNDGDDLDPAVGSIGTTLSMFAVVWVDETKPPTGCQLLPNDVELRWAQGTAWEQLGHEC